MTFVTVVALWLVLSLLLCVFVVALCRAGNEEDEHRAAMARRPRRGPRQGRGSRPAV